MQRVTLVRYTAKPERADENAALSRAVFDELRRQAPENVCYALFRDGNDFVHVFINFKADDSSPLTELPAFKAFGRSASERQVTPADQIRIATHLVDSYGFGAMAPA